MKPNLFGLILLLPAFLSGVIACYAWRRRSIPGATIIFFLMLGTSVAVFAYGMELISLAMPDKLIWVKIRYMGTALIYPMLLLLTLWYTNRRQVLRRPEQSPLRLRHLISGVCVGHY